MVAAEKEVLSGQGNRSDGILDEIVINEQPSVFKTWPDAVYHRERVCRCLSCAAFGKHILSGMSFLRPRLKIVKNGSCIFPAQFSTLFI